MDILNAAINVLKQNQSKIDQAYLINFTAIPENAEHAFYDYKILNTNIFLPIACIKACSEAKRELDLQKAAHQASKSKSINSIESMSSSSTQSDKAVAISQIMSVINEDSKQDF